MAEWAELVRTVGISTAILVVVAVYHARVVVSKDKEIARINEKKDTELAKKDTEISRINELRVSESKASQDKLLDHNEKSMELLGDVDTTLKLLTERIK